MIIINSLIENRYLIASPNFRLMLTFSFGDFFHQSEVARPYSWQVKMLKAIFQKL